MGDVADMELLVRGDQEMKERSPQKEEFQDLTFKKETVGNRKGSGKTKLDRAYKWILPLMVLAGLAIIAVTVIRVYKPSTSSRIGVKPGSLPVDRGHPKFPNFNRTRPVGFQVHTAEADSPEPWLHIRLPGDIQPVLYNISFFPDFYDERGQFFGNQTLELMVVKSTRVLVLHADGLNITDVSLTDSQSGKDIAINDTFYHTPFNYFVVRTVDPVPKDAGLKLYTSFQGSMLSGLNGLYKSSYFDTVAKETRHLATTHFEPVAARKAFPCLDEPNLKAEFSIRVIHRDSYTALSNMPTETTHSPVWEESEDLVVTTFQRSVKMSTYLVCVIVCDFGHIQIKSSSGKLIRVYAPDDRLSQAHYALQVAKHTVDDFEGRLKIDYVLPKVDLVAIPDFSSGAMENWGLITFRETALLCDPDSVSANAQQRVAEVVVQELAHQWFGNLVTMNWWNDVWLNKGFASYMQYVGTSTKQPAWDMMSQIVLNDVHRAMVDDALLTTHPIVVDVTYPDEISAIFDTISYQKGASVLQMLQNIMEQEGKDFYKGIHTYLEAHKAKNAITNDLWTALSKEIVTPNIRDVMDTWTLQEGYPLVNIELTEDDGQVVVHATQTRFTSDPADSHTVSSKESKWYISLDWITSEHERKEIHYMPKTDAAFKANVQLSHPASWVKFNVDTKGFYRVNYPSDMWKRLSSHLLTTDDVTTWRLTASDRSGLLSDAFTLAQVGQVTYDIPLGLAKYLTKERNYVPWASAVADGLQYISSMMQLDPHYELWEIYVRSLVNPVLDKMGWMKTGSHLERQLQGVLVKQACQHNDETALHQVHMHFRDMIDKGLRPNPDIERSVYQYGMALDSTESDWDAVWSKYLHETVAQEKENLLLALASTRIPYLIERLLEAALHEEGIRRQDFFTLIGYVSSNQIARPLLWDWIRTHYEVLVERFTVEDRNFGKMVPSFVSSFNTERDLYEVLEFFDSYPNAGAGLRPREAAAASIRKNILWMNAFRPQVIDWLRSNVMSRGKGVEEEEEEESHDLRLE